MNVCKPERQAAALSALVEGASIRSAERMTGVNRDTIQRVLVRVGAACAQLMDARMRCLPCQRVQVDELWCYVAKKQRQVRGDDDRSRVGDFYTFVALDSDTKLVPSFRVCKRDGPNTRAFIADLATRMHGRIQLSTDAWTSYREAVDTHFGSSVDYAQVVKSYEAEYPDGSARYSPPRVVAVDKTPIYGKPDLKQATTSHVERLNLSIRMGSRRFTRLTNAFSKKPENLRAAVAVHFAHYNFVRRHQTIGCTPAMAAGLESKPWTMADLVSLVG